MGWEFTVQGSQWWDSGKSPEEGRETPLQGMFLRSTGRGKADSAGLVVTSR